MPVELDHGALVQVLQGLVAVGARDELCEVLAPEQDDELVILPLGCELASWAAMRLSLMWPLANPRAWFVTPLRKGRNHLPSFDRSNGIDPLHLAERTIMVTREPRVAPGQATWRLADLRAAIRAPATGVPAVDRGRVLAPAAPLRALDAAWGVALDNAGSVVARYRGDAAFDVEP